MDLRQLAYFVAVVDKGTISAAAKSLYMSQPPLSLQIQALEQEFGVSLFDRSTRRMRLTEAGRVLYARARDILDVCSSVKSEMADMQRGVSGTMRLGVVSSICSPFLFRRLKDFCEKDARRKVRLQLYEADTYRLLEMVRGRQVELAFVRTPFAAEDLQKVVFQREPLYAAGLPMFFRDEIPLAFGLGSGLGSDSGSEKSPNKTLPSVSLQFLASHPIIFYRRWEQILLDIFQTASVTPDVFCVSDDARTTLSLAKAGFGLGIIPQSILEGNSGECMALPISHPELVSDICAVYREDTYMSQLTQLFLEELQGHYEHKRQGEREAFGGFSAFEDFVKANEATENAHKE